jgi:hypothetical protein
VNRVRRFIRYLARVLASPEPWTPEGLIAARRMGEKAL